MERMPKGIYTSEFLAPNVMDQRFATSAPNKAGITDITHIPTDEDWLYLVGGAGICSTASWSALP